MKTSKREIILAVSTLTVFLFGITGYLIDKYSPTWKAMQTDIAAIEHQISRHKTAIRKEKDWRNELSTLQSNLRVFDLSERSVSPKLMQAIKQMAKENSLDILRSQPYDEKMIDDLFEKGINLTWEGSLEAIVNFLTTLQTQGARYDVRQLNISPDNRNPGMLKGNMVIDCAFIRSNIPKEEEKEEVISEEPNTKPQQS